MKTALALFLLAGSVSAQEVVKLRNGRTISGTVVIDESDQNGFRVVLWNSGGTVYLLKSQVSEQEWNRLRRRPVETEGELFQGVRITTTSGREYLGLLVNAGGATITPLPLAKEQLDVTVRIKTRESTSPVMVPRSVVEFYEVVRVREAEVYSPAEMVERRVKETDPKDVAKLLEVGQFARRLKMYARAKEILTAAAAADPARKAEIDEQIAELDRLIKDQQAEAKLAEITKLAETGKFDDALEAAEKFLQEFGETALGKKNADLPQRLQKDREDYVKNRAEFLAKKVPDAWRSIRSSLLSEYAKSKYKLPEARQLVGRMDDVVRDAVAKKFNSPPEDVEKAWERREPKKKTVDMGTGSWIHKGGQDGGLDYESGGGGKEEDAIDDFTRRFGGGKKKNDATKNEAGNKLDTSEKWWSDADQGKRERWLETEYALTSKFVKRDKEEEKKCSRCLGKGTVRASREGKQVDVICPVCHKTGVVVSVTYW